MDVLLAAQTDGNEVSTSLGIDPLVFPSLPCPLATYHE